MKKRPSGENWQTHSVEVAVSRKGRGGSNPLSDTNIKAPVDQLAGVASLRTMTVTGSNPSRGTNLKLKVFNHGNCMTIQVNDGPLGAATADMDLMGDHWWLARLVVKHQYRRQGIGRQLIDNLKKNCRGLPIEVMPGGYDTPRAQQFAFYRACGFKDVDRNTMKWSPVLG